MDREALCEQYRKASEALVVAIYAVALTAPRGRDEEAIKDRMSRLGSVADEINHLWLKTFG